jgi:hypothetical protein
VSRSLPARNITADRCQGRSWSPRREDSTRAEAQLTPYPFSVWTFHDHEPPDEPPPEATVWTPPAWVPAALVAAALLWWALVAALP